MANRKNRNLRYQQNVVGKIGKLDLVSVSGNGDHIINARGGKVYHDLNKHAFLEIPESGKAYEVLSVGNHQFNHSGLVATVKVGDLVQVFQLPKDYAGWVESLRSASMMGMKLLPANVEFGKRDDGNYYAEIL